MNNLNPHTRNDAPRGCGGCLAGATASADAYIAEKVAAANLYSQSSTQACDAPKSLEIPEQLNRMFEVTDYLSESLAGLEGRLYQVLIPRCPTEDAGKAAVGCSSLGATLASLNARLALMLDCVNSVKARLQI